MTAIRSTPSAARLLALSVVARVPLAMLGIALLVHAQRLTGSFASAGAVAGAYAVTLGTGGPLLAALVDRRGQTAVLLVSSCLSAVLLLALGLVPQGAPLGVLVALAAGIGLATPPIGACLRTLLPSVLTGADELRAAYAVDASASELAWVSGPPLALGVGAVWSTGAPLVLAALVLLAATAVFAAQPASRTWRPDTIRAGTRGSSLRGAGLRTLVLALTAVGFLFGAVEVAVTSSAASLGSTTAAGPLLALWGLGSLAGGLLVARLGGGTRGAHGLALVLAGLAAGHLALVVSAGSLVALGAALLVAGTAIAPTYATAYAMVERLAPPGTLTEAFAWLATAIAVGTAAGSAIAGTTVDHAGPVAAFALAGGAGTIAVLTTVLRAHSLRPEADAVAGGAGPVACGAAA
jgi:MFS family permease